MHWEPNSKNGHQTAAGGAYRAANGWLFNVNSYEQLLSLGIDPSEIDDFADYLKNNSHGVVLDLSPYVTAYRKTQNKTNDDQNWKAFVNDNKSVL